MEEIWEYVGRTEERNYVVARPTRTQSVSSFWRFDEVEFRRLFSDLPAEEVLIADYFCALDRDFLRQGRLFITSRHLCFHASIFGFLETRVQLPWTLVTNLKKKKTVKVIPNAIKVECAASSGQPPLRFCSFFARDKTFTTLWNTWQQAVADSLLSQHDLTTTIQLLSAVSYSSTEEVSPNDASDTLNPRVMDDLDVDEATWLGLIETYEQADTDSIRSIYNSYHLTSPAEMLLEPSVEPESSVDEPPLGLISSSAPCMITLDLTLTLIFIIIGLICVQNGINPYRGLIQRPF